MAYRTIPIPPGSSNVQGVEYDDAAGVLRVTFVREGRQGRYVGVPGSVADGFTISGQSAGAYLNSSVKNQYPYEPGG